jgi:hypothetical protein
MRLSFNRLVCTLLTVPFVAYSTICLLKRGGSVHMVFPIKSCSNRFVSGSADLALLNLFLRDFIIFFIGSDSYFCFFN